MRWWRCAATWRSFCPGELPAETDEGGRPRTMSAFATVKPRRLRLRQFPNINIRCSVWNRSVFLPSFLPLYVLKREKTERPTV